MNITETSIIGCYVLRPNIFEDDRGTFTKVFHEEEFKKKKLSITYTEQYYSVSRANVLRGLHFQTPPKDHCKMVYCVFGSVIDVVVDLRINSPSYGKYQMFDLNDTDKTSIYIPTGCAHGFYVNSEKAILIYNVTSSYSSEHDSGISWESLDIPWPNRSPIVSKRDSEFINFSNFRSPFMYNQEV